MVAKTDYVGLQPAWCPGCGNFGILNAFQRALVELNIEPHRVLMVSGIGQAGKMPHYAKGNVFNSLHGRTLPPATGAKIANPELFVVAIGGDGDGYAEGGNHFLHAMRRNHDITYLVHDNQVYGLTKGQTSPTSDQGFVTKTTPQGAEMPVNPMPLAIIAGATFVARGFAGDVDHLTELIRSAIQHKGFAIVDILQPCVTFNHRNTYDWYRERVNKLGGTDHDPTDMQQALLRAEEWGERIPIGLIYQTYRPTFEERLPGLKRGSLVKQSIDPLAVEKLFGEFI